ncbi:hypothetical protein BaRGS_00019741 [Batillaria attramentaria]|uniref:SAM domain-containing protein n=1 Tax=Batillaria attramentaria TaxID=370345 RepID=A0ABD0KPU0_9CAEN
MEVQGAEAGGGGQEAVSMETLPTEHQATSQPPASKESVSSTGSAASASGSAAPAARKVLKGKPKPLHFWTSADVNKWWRKHGGLCYQLYGDLLTEHDVGGRTLIRMNEIKLEKIGITNVEHRHELMQHILRLRLKHEMAELKNLEQRGVGFELKLPDPLPVVDKGEKTEKNSKDKVPPSR